MWLCFKGHFGCCVDNSYRDKSGGRKTSRRFPQRFRERWYGLKQGEMVRRDWTLGKDWKQSPEDFLAECIKDGREISQVWLQDLWLDHRKGRQSRRTKDWALGLCNVKGVKRKGEIYRKHGEVSKEVGGRSMRMWSLESRKMMACQEDVSDAAGGSK